MVIAPAPPLIKKMSDADVSPFHRFLIIGPTGSGKSGLIRTLPGKKLVYIFDPNTMPTIYGTPECDYVEFLPEFQELDATLKGFNKDPKTGKTYHGDKPVNAVEPKLFNKWREHFNALYDSSAYKNYDWLIFDSATFFTKALMDRQLYINNRYGDLTDRADYRVVGDKLSDIFGKMSGLGINMLLTAHMQTWQDEKTSRISTQMATPGNSRTMLPLSYTSVMEAFCENGKYFLRTVPQGGSGNLRDIRTSIPGLLPVEDVTIKDMKRATDYGIGALLKKGQKANALHK